MAYLINRIEQSLRSEGLAPRTDKARAWLQSKVKSLNPSRTRLMEDKSRLRDSSIVGNMYFYYYDPKTKDLILNQMKKVKAKHTYVNRLNDMIEASE